VRILDVKLDDAEAVTKEIAIAGREQRAAAEVMKKMPSQRNSV